VNKTLAGTGLAVSLLIAAQPLFSKLDGTIKSKRQDLDSIRKELSKKKQEKTETAKKAEELAQEVERVSREISESRRALKDVQGRIGETESRRRAAEERLWVSRAGMGQWVDVLSRELSRLYERRLVEGSSAFVELAYREAAVRDKVNGLAFAQQHHAQVEKLRDELVQLEVDLQKLRLRREKEELRGEALQKRLRALHKTVEGRRALLEKDIRELQSSARNLEKMIQSLVRQQAQSRKAAGGKPLAHRKKGRLPWPVEGKVIERYGRSKHPELETFVFSNGVKLRPAAADFVRSIDKGEVMYAGEFMSYGLMALIQHPDNLHSVYGHLGRLNVSRGQTVSVGEIIGTPGQDAARQPVVYFELRVGGMAVDPLSWLQ
jgi:murein hydrolase activator